MIFGRRDRRSNALAGDAMWGVPGGSRNHEAEDELLRYEGELEHIDYFTQKTTFLMEKYLTTENGRAHAHTHTHTHLAVLVVDPRTDEVHSFGDLRGLAVKSSIKRGVCVCV